MERPIISNYQDLPRFMGDMLAFRKASERHFSVLRVTRTLRRVSPALVSLMVRGERKVTTDRADEVAKLLGLSLHEKQYFKDWVARRNGEHSTQPDPGPAVRQPSGRRKAVSSHLLSDWINVYVKDAFQLKRVRKNPQEVYSILAGVASQRRIDRAIQFLLRAGYLRKDGDGKIVEDTPLHVVDPKVPNHKVRQFHKGALKTALQAIDQYPSHLRHANALILALDEQGYQELTQLMEEVAEQFQRFAERAREGDRLYQVIINLSPTGGLYE